MGKWRYDEHGWLQAEGQDESIEGINEAMRFHNADIDALRAELARVKAESLRVVPVPVPDHGLMYDWYMTPTGLGYPGKDRKNNNCIESAEGYYRLDECKPVRLERWEDE